MVSVRLHATVRGFVQGVSFRLKAMELADELHLTGSVRHTGPRTMVVDAEGPRPKLEILLAWLHVGPPVARVDAVRAAWSRASGRARSFRILSGR